MPNEPSRPETPNGSSRPETPNGSSQRQAVKWGAGMCGERNNKKQEPEPPSSAPLSFEEKRKKVATVLGHVCLNTVQKFKSEEAARSQPSGRG